MARRNKKADEESESQIVDPDRPKLRQEFSVSNPEPGDKRVRFVGDGTTRYVPGRPAVIGAIEAVSEEEAEALIGTGLYEEAPDDAEVGVPENATAADNVAGDGEPQKGEDS